MSTRSFEIPEGNGKKMDDIELIPTGFHLCGMYGICDIGTQDTNFGSKRQIKLAFEFPMHKRVFWEGEEARPASIFVTETMSLGNRANLRKRFIEPMIGRSLTKEEEKTYNPAQLVGTYYIANVTHSDDGKWANISSIAPLNTTNMGMYRLQQPAFQFHNPFHDYHLSDGFMSDSYKNLTSYLRKVVAESDEGKAHKAAGGTFAEPPKQDQNNNSGGAGGNAGAVLEMKPDSQYTLEALRASSYTDQQIVDGGFGFWKLPTPPPAPVTSTPPPPVQGSVPPPVNSGIAPPPTASGIAPPPTNGIAPPPTKPAVDPKYSNGVIELVESQRGNDSLEDWLKVWSAEDMVAQGHARPVAKQ